MRGVAVVRELDECQLVHLTSPIIKEYKKKTELRGLFI
jgi:hypothetical protein